MTSDKIKEVLKAEPFRPFRLHMGNDRHADVAHPELMTLSPSGRIGVVFGLNDAMEIIDVFMVQSIEMLPHRGRAGRRRSA